MTSYNEKLTALRKAGVKPESRAKEAVDKAYDALPAETAPEPVAATPKPVPEPVAAPKPVPATPKPVAAPKPKPKAEPAKDGEIYTYVGAGDEPPHLINFMGLQKFIRGQATPVSNPQVLGKIVGHPCFVKGEADIEEMYEKDEVAKARAVKSKKRDQKLEDEANKRNKKHK